MFDRRGRLTWLLASFALSPMASDAGDAQSSAPATQSPEDAQTSKPSTSKPARSASSSTSVSTGTEEEVDDELLEFLGSVDGEEDSELLDYLSRHTSGKAKDRVSRKTARDK